MLKEIISTYKKEALNVVLRLVYSKHNSARFYSFFNSYDRICNT